MTQDTQYRAVKVRPIRPNTPGCWSVTVEVIRRGSWTGEATVVVIFRDGAFRASPDNVSPGLRQKGVGFRQKTREGIAQAALKCCAALGEVK